MSYKIFFQRGTGAYASAETLDDALKLAAESHKELGRNVWIISEDESEGLDGNIRCNISGTRVNPVYIPYLQEEYNEIIRSRERDAEREKKEEIEDSKLRAEISAMYDQ